MTWGVDGIGSWKMGSVEPYRHGNSEVQCNCSAQLSIFAVHDPGVDFWGDGGLATFFGVIIS